MKGSRGDLLIITGEIPSSQLLVTALMAVNELVIVQTMTG